MYNCCFYDKTDRETQSCVRHQVQGHAITALIIRIFLAYFYPRVRGCECMISEDIAFYFVFIYLFLEGATSPPPQ